MEDSEKKWYENAFRGKNVMVIGGLGFIGSNLVRKLIELNPAKIVIVDSLIKGLGGNIFNVDGIHDKVEIPDLDLDGVDIRNNSKMAKLIQGIDYIFNLAGSVSHIDSKNRPLRDLELNLEAHVALLEVCRDYIEREKTKLKIVFAATRDIYGKVKEKHLPAKEDLIIEEATDPQGITNYAAEFYHLWYRNFGIQSCSLRITNTYGPRHQMLYPHGFLNWFIRKAIDNKEIELWGGGKSLRDFNYVDDVVEALLIVMASDKSDGKVYNLGSCIRKEGRYEHICDNVKTVGEVAKIIVELSKSGSCKEIDYPEEKKDIEPGHFCADSTKIYEELGWEPKVDLREGIKRTIDFYKNNKKYYW